MASQCLKIAQNVAFNIASEASYVYNSTLDGAQKPDFDLYFALKIIKI